MWTMCVGVDTDEITEEKETKACGVLFEKKRMGLSTE